MTKKAHTPEERAHLLEAIGAPTEAVEAEREPDKPKPARKAKTKEPSHDGLEHDVPTIVSSIVARAGADRDMALSLGDEFAQGVFDANKVSKVQAAARGIESSSHNKALWTSVQNLRTAIKAAIRKHYSTTIAAKVRKTSAAADDKKQARIEAFIASDAFMRAMEVFEKEGEPCNDS